MPHQHADPLGLAGRAHPLRASLSQEMHLRRLPRFAAPARFLQIVLVVDHDQAAASRAQVSALGAGALAEGARHALFDAAPFQGVWERHAEFVTYGFLLPGPFTDGLDAAAFAGVAPIVAAMPGAVIRATLVALMPTGSEAVAAALATAAFGEDGLVACDVAGGKARIWSDFRLGPDAVGRLLIADRGLTGDEPAQLVQRLQELGNYRNMALLGLPVAQRLAPALAALEQRLAAVTARVAATETSDAGLLDELTRVSAEIAQAQVDARYRMSATEAYAKIVEERLASLEVTPLAGHQTLTDFTDRRLMPAVRTCTVAVRRLEEQAQHASRTSALLRTRIDTALAHQSKDLLASMNRRTEMQLRLQQAVEGLSVVAVSYYLIGLLEHVLRPVHAIDHELVVALLAPVALILVAIGLVRVRRHSVEPAPCADTTGTMKAAPD